MYFWKVASECVRDELEHLLRILLSRLGSGLTLRGDRCAELRARPWLASVCVLRRAQDFLPCRLVPLVNPDRLTVSALCEGTLRPVPLDQDLRLVDECCPIIE